MTQPYGRRIGFGLVELLVAMSILGIVLAALLALTSGTTRFTVRSTITSDGVRDLSDATGYLGDAFRSATEVLPPSSMITTDTGSFECDAPTCVAFEVPTFDATTGDSGAAALNVYRLIPRSELLAAWRSDPPYVTGPSEVPQAIVRYVSLPGSTVVSSTFSLLLDNVVLNDSSLTYDATNDTLDVAVRIGRVVRDGVTFLPADGALVTSVVRRN